MVRHLALTLATLALAAPLAAAGATGPLPAPATESAQRLAPMRDLVALAIAAGLPDAEGASLHRGRIWVSRVLGDGRTHRYQVDGLHAKLPDGRWLIGLQQVQEASAPEPDAVELKPVAVGSLVAAFADENRQTISEETHHYLMQQVIPADRERVRAALAGLPVLVTLHHGGPTPALAVAHLIRLEAPCAHDVAVLFSVLQASDRFAQTFAKTAPLRIGAEMPGRHDPATTPIAVPDAATALRHGLFLHFRGLALGFDPDDQSPARASVPERDPQAALASAASLLTPEDVPAHADLALHRARLTLPDSVPANAPLADRLAVWNGGLAPGVTIANRKPRAHGSTWTESLQAGVITPLTISEAELDALFPLLDDPRPSRWLDRTMARTLGDNALRAIAALIGCDPRVFVGRDPAAPWTDQERSATAAELRAWWSANHHRPVEEFLIEAVPLMPLGDLIRLLSVRSAEDRAPFVAALAKAWAAGPPPGITGRAVADLLAATAADQDLFSALASWPVTADLAPTLAAVHLTRGNRKPLDELFAATLAEPLGDPIIFTQVIGLVRHAPTAAHLRRLTDLLAGPLDAPPSMTLVRIMTTGIHASSDGLIQRWAIRQANGDHDEARRRAQILPLALYALLLADQRPMTESLRQEALQLRGGMHRHGKPMAPVELAGDLRIADYAGWCFQFIRGQMPELLGEGLSLHGDEFAVYLATPRAERDRQLATLRREIAAVLVPALAAAGLPDLVPPAPPAGDEAQF